MTTTNATTVKVGILGGGQLGRMLIQSGIDFNIPFMVLDPDEHAPCASLAPFTQGKLTDYETVLNFGSACDIVTIEIENVNAAALKALVAKGVKVYPQPDLIEMIQDKRSQKLFYQQHNIPTAEFVLVENAEDAAAKATSFPIVNKLGREGYDGRGVQILKTREDLAKAFDAPGILEKLIPFKKEITVIVPRSESGDTKTFPAVEMVFHPEQNLVEYLFAPADLKDSVREDADSIAQRIVTQLQLVGVLAVEMFVTQDDRVLVNEIAPRPHNSGHQTIEANVTSQYEQHLRAILNLPLGDTSAVGSSAMVNLLGEPGFSGEARYEGLTEVLKLKSVHVHLYGKRITKPFRKMGHVTIVDEDVDQLKRKTNFIKQTLKVIA